ncbi:MAG: type VI secretion system baseplate subunit TssK [Bacteroidetes bacterium]|jgi:type VI secretion system protein ImpJ|nr:type VI secretion system baseplate subunit TssK [Bacteroidota bacterium]
MAQFDKRVVWYEGMTLDPHHFQQWDRHVAQQLHTRMQATMAHGWGFMELGIDRDRLANGTLALTRCRGVMSDGLVFDIPDTDPLPEPRAVEEAFPATAEVLEVALAVPAHRTDGGNIERAGSPAGREPRFTTETLTVPDDTTGADERPVEVAHGRFRLLFGGEPRQALRTMKLAEVVRTSSGVYQLREGFIPPCLFMEASDVLMRLARRLLEVMVTRSAELTSRARGIRQQREVSVADVTALGLASAINTYLPVVKHHHASGTSHPEVFFEVMLELGGQLSIYADAKPLPVRDFPVYDHGAPSEPFATLDTAVREMLGGAAPPSNFTEVPLNTSGENLYTATLEAAMLSGSALYLIARDGSMPAHRRAAELPLMLRIATPDTIDPVLRSYTRALPVDHATTLPGGVPVDEEATYFQLQQTGPFWEAITKEQALALYVPPDFRDVSFDLIAVKTA